MICESCGKHIAENQKTLTRGAFTGDDNRRTYHAKCAPYASVSTLLRDMANAISFYDLEFRFAEQGQSANAGRGISIWSEVRVVKNGVRLSTSVAYEFAYALDIALEPWRTAKFSPADVLEMVANGGHGRDCVFCQEKEEGPAQSCARLAVLSP